MKRKKMLIIGGLCIAVCAGALSGCGDTGNSGEKETYSVVERSVTESETEVAAQTPEKVDFNQIPEGFRIVTIGSGAPGVDPARGNASTLVQYQDKYFLVDCGYGTCETLTELGLGVESISNVLFTHQHEDHNADFDHFLLAGWYNAAAGRKSINLVGPQVQQLYDDIYEINKDDIDGRLEVGARQGAGVTTEGISENVNIVNVTDSDYSLELDGVQIDMHKVVHGNMQAYSYRFTAGEQSVVVTGDVSYTEDLAEFYKDADILVVDALTLTGYFSNFTEDQIEHQMSGTHMSQRQLGTVFADSNVKKVVLTHISGDFTDLDASIQAFEDAGYSGEVLGAYDGFFAEP